MKFVLLCGDSTCSHRKAVNRPGSPDSGGRISDEGAVVQRVAAATAANHGGLESHVRGRFIEADAEEGPRDEVSPT